MATPLAVVLLLLMDTVFIMNTAFLEPIFLIISLMSVGVLNLHIVSELIDGSYQVLFGMSKIDVEGFRRMRTIH
jgi:hypothetical protein